MSGAFNGAVTAMGPALQAEYDLLQGEICALGYYFREYETMFGTTRERIDFLNKVAPVFFQMIVDTLWSEMLMHMTRMTESAVTKTFGGAFQNLTVQRLPALVDDAIRPTITALVKVAVDASKFAHPAHNKVMAHRDLHVALNPEAAGITMGSRRQMGAAIGAIEAVLDAVGKHYDGLRTSWVHDLGWGIADDLIEMLELGWKAQQAQIAGAG